MYNLIYEKLSDPTFLVSFLVAVATTATLITLLLPFMHTDTLGRRLKNVGIERRRIRDRERERLAQERKTNVRYQPRLYMNKIVERFNVSKWIGTAHVKNKLLLAGYRGRESEIAFMFFTLITPIGAFIISFLYLFLFLDDYPLVIHIGIALLVAYLGMKAPEIFLKNSTSKRQTSMKQAFPDALDLLLICVESGMSMEHAIRKVSQEIGLRSVPLAEEMALTAAELAFLPERRQALENFALRTGLDSVRQIVTVLIQSERYGTPLGTALRVVAQESRDNRMLEAERKAAALPPKLTVPMILFFLPVLFAVILTPAILQLTSAFK